MTRFLPLVLLVPLALALDACSASDVDPVEKAAAKTSDASGARIRYDGAVRQNGDTTTSHVEGVLARDGASRGRMDLTVLGKPHRYAFVVVVEDGKRVTYSREDGDARWTKRVEDADEPLDFLFQPGKLLARFAKVADVERRGEEQVGGADATRYRLTAQKDATDAERAEAGLDQGPVDVWIDDAGYLRKMALDTDEAAYSVTLSDFGLDPQIEAPPADQVAPSS